MNCCMDLPSYCEDNFTESKNDAIKRIETDHPIVKKMIKLLDKKTKIREVAFSGDLFFNEFGNISKDENERRFKYKIVYVYNEVLESNLKNKWDYRLKPKEFIYTF